MQKNSIHKTGNKLNPLFQQYLLQSRVHTRDYAFFLRKFTFMQQAAGAKKEESCNYNNG